MEIKLDKVTEYWRCTRMYNAITPDWSEHAKVKFDKLNDSNQQQVV